MTNTIEARKWFTSKPSVKSGYNKVYELLRLDAPADEVAALFEAMTKIRGAHRVEIESRSGAWTRASVGRWVESPWFSISFRGTDRAVHGARNLLMMSSLQNLDPNADHDHAGCIARARAMGVPAWSAHTPETYLSS